MPTSPICREKMRCTRPTRGRCAIWGVARAVALKSNTICRRSSLRKRPSRPRLSACRSQGYLDDAAFSQFWIENRLRFRPRGATALRYELRQKGVDKETIDAELAELDEEEAAWNAVEQKLDRWRGLAPTRIRTQARGSSRPARLQLLDHQVRECAGMGHNS